MGVLKRFLALVRGHSSDMHESPPVPRRTCLVARGDDLWKIATREYGDPNWWFEIFNANKRRLKAPELVHAGMTLRLP